MQGVTPELREGLDYSGPGGVLVSRVVRDGPADRGGVRKGDLIVRLNSRVVASAAELQDVVRSAKVGQTMAVQVFRDGAERTLSVTLGTRPTDEEMETPEAPEAPEPSEAPFAMEILPEHLQEFDLPGDRTIRVFTDVVNRGRLGVRIESLSPALGDYFGLKDGKGVLVLEVLEDTPAQRAGLEPGDVITRAGDRVVSKGEDLVEALRGKEGKVALRVVRHGTPRTVEATLEKQTARRGSGPVWTTPAPGVRRQLRMHLDDRDQMRRQIDQLRRQLDDLRRKLDQQPGGERGD
jgi:serine protease Do